MKFGPVPPKKLPQQDPSRVLLLAEKWQRAAYAQQRWAEQAKIAVDFFEGRQWTEAQLNEMRRKRRPAFKFNMIAPLVRLVLGYQRSNKTDITFLPGQDARASEELAEALTRIEKVIAEGSHMDYVDTEVFLDGLICARGYYDTRLDFESNDLGEVKTRAADPFSIYPDPDASTYDFNESAAHISESSFVSLDEIDAWFGKDAMDLLKPFILGQTPLAPVSSYMVVDEVSPIRTYGERADTEDTWWDTFYSLVGDFVDPSRKTIRLINMQWKQKKLANVLIDLETGDKAVLPEEWKQEEIQKVLLYADQVKNPVKIQRRTIEFIQWTTFAGDLLLYDQESQYDSYTLQPYFPYFRRGITRGMVEDLIDPQMEKNKHRSARSEIAAKTANGGWKYSDDAFDAPQEANLKKFGSSPGVNIKFKSGAKHPPEQIVPGGPANAHKILEDDAGQDLKDIAGINEAALGQEMNVQSGRAIQAKQRQAVLSIQVYMDNFKRSKMLVGDQHLKIIQRYYTEPRLYRIMGKDGKFGQVLLNQEQQDPTSGLARIANDVTIGKYTVVIDDSPLSDTFLNAQFNEMLTLLGKMGPAIAPYIPMFADLIIDMSSMPRKDEWIERIKAVWEAQQQQAQAGQAPPGHPAPGQHPQHGHPHAQPHHGAPHHAAPHQGQEQPGPLGGGPVAENVVPFSR
ncbi:MAG: portal protein [Xanthobacteraceae bacterium]|jgi:hypothetical protein